MFLIKRVILFFLLNGSFNLLSQNQLDQQVMDLSKEGISADTIKEYYGSGTLKSLYFPYKKTYKYKGEKYHYCLFVTYDENGKCTRHTDDKIGYEQKFDANGDLISYMIYDRRKSKLNYYIEFFPKSTKRKVITNGNRYDYDENERLRCHWMRKSMRNDKKFGDRVASFYFEVYDVAGEISKNGRFYTQLYDQDQWIQLAPEFPDDLDSVPIQDFKEIVYPQLFEKEVYRWEYIENKTILTRYEQQGDSWAKIRRKTLPRYPKRIGYGI